MSNLIEGKFDPQYEGIIEYEYYASNGNVLYSSEPQMTQEDIDEAEIILYSND